MYSKTENKSFHFTAIGRFSIYLILIFISTSVVAQDNPLKFVPQKQRKVISIGFRAGYGVIIPHRESMIHLVTGHVATFETFFERAGYKRVWNKYYGYPSNGLNLYFGYLANPTTLGNALSIDYYSNMHLIKRKQRFLFDMRMSAGLGYLTKIFDPEFNNQDVAIGSHLNISVGLSFDFKWKINPNWLLGVGLSLKHFSNGAFTTPNLGINIPCLTLSLKKLARFSANPEYEKMDTTRIAMFKKIHKRFTNYQIIGGLGIKEIYPSGGAKYGVYSLELNATYHHTYRSAFIGGLDVMHNVALYEHAIRYDTIFSGTKKEITQLGISIGYSQVYHKFELFIQNGFYLVNRYNKDGGIYQRLGGRYFLNKKFVFQFALKTHFAKADYFEIGIGYNLRKLKMKN